MDVIPFESFADLIFRLSHPPKPLSSSTGKLTPLSPSVIFTSWLNHHRPLGPKAGKYLFRLLFPHEGSRRRYGLKETRLSHEIGSILGLQGLSRWDGVAYEGEAGTGCLGRELETMMKERIPKGQKSDLTISQLDELLDSLASLSPFSQLSQPGPSTLTQSTLLTRLYRDVGLSPYAMAVLTQIILRDLRPLLNPLPRLTTRNPTAMLRLKSNLGPAQLELYQAMKCLNPKMLELYNNGKGDIDWCADAIEAISTNPLRMQMPCGPIVGVNVQIPKCRKGRSCEDALKAFSGHGAIPHRLVYAEAKHDGYRMQIHVKISLDDDVDITIFSKSKRNSTKDRLNTHSMIRAALGLPHSAGLPTHPTLLSRIADAPRRRRHVTSSVILEAEVVPYNETGREGARGPGIEEFWHLGAAGVTAGDAEVSQWKSSDRHLCLVFFDILHLDGESLLGTCYEERRRYLQDVVVEVPGFSQIVERTPIPLSRGSVGAREALQGAFDKSNAAREEGLVLKAAESRYLDRRFPWVKLKKDYIPNLGDCIDLVVLGAGWDADRARELRVDTSVFTSFFIGVLTNSDKVKSRLETPHFEILFRASYGMDRTQLEVYNENIRMGRWRSKPFDRDDPLKRRLIGLSWTYHLPRSMAQPSIMFEQPLCAEVMGAGFQKVPFSQYYELRWPRLQKIFPPNERKWTEALSGRELIASAHQALGYKNTPTLLSPQDDSIRAAWRSSTQTCFDVPDLDSSISLSPAGKRRRMQSAPDLMILKTSPPTPPRSSPLRQPRSSGIRMQTAVAFGSHANDIDQGRLPMCPGTPVSSPAPGLLGSPIRTQRITEEPAQPVGMRTPISSPFAPTRTVSMPRSIDAIFDTKDLRADEPVRKQPRLRPLSLRSRLKLAARRSITGQS